jgi:hypothetical protein
MATKMLRTEQGYIVTDGDEEIAFVTSTGRRKWHLWRVGQGFVGGPYATRREALHQL